MQVQNILNKSKKVELFLTLYQIFVIVKKTTYYFRIFYIIGTKIFGIRNNYIDQFSSFYCLSPDV
ncbi:MAG: hypothetical protein A2Y54_06010 [Chloroflexi bacterium RBG_16_51_16]|nr:MAG: hypothetical protein A2Y54_06010 [Chloroflexi bacterium RBG_16_51_16]